MKASISVLMIFLAVSLGALTPQEFTQSLAEIRKTEDKKTPATAIEKYRELLKTADNDQKAAVFERLALFAASAGKQDAVLDEALKGIRDLPAAPQKASAVASIIQGIRAPYYDVAKKLFADNESSFSDDQKIALHYALADSAARMNDAKTFDRAREFILKQPLEKRIDITGRLAQLVADQDFAKGVKMLRDTLAIQGITPVQKVKVLHELMRLTINKSSPFDYAAVKAIKAEVDALVAGKEVPPDAASATYAVFGADAALRACDYPAAKEAFEKVVTANPKNWTVAFQAAGMALLFNDKEAAARHLDLVIAGNPKIPGKDIKDAGNIKNAAIRYQASVMKALDSGKAISDVDKEFAEYGFTSEQRMNMLRDASTRLLVARRDNDVRAIHAEVEKMFKPLAEKVFTVRYAANVPRSAGAWECSPLLKDAQYKETRFERQTSIWKDVAPEAARLKDAPANPKDAIPAGYETAAFMAYDESGLHIYVQTGNPDAPQIDLGLMPGGFIEMFLQPGAEKPYHWLMYSLPGIYDKYAAFMASPGKHFRYAYDHIVKNTCVNPAGIGAYTFIPWMLCYDSLPVGGNDWKLGIIRGDKAGDGYVMVSFGGNVHELARGLTLKFDFSPAQLSAVKRHIALRAFAGYRTLRNDRASFISDFKDPELGDPAFYAAEVEPLLKDLDAAGEKLVGQPAPSDKEIDAIFDKYVPLWAEIKYVVADKRVAYLKKGWLSE